MADETKANAWRKVWAWLLANVMPVIVQVASTYVEAKIAKKG